jgi:hypothetical protein
VCWKFFQRHPKDHPPLLISTPGIIFSRIQGVGLSRSLDFTLLEGSSEESDVKEVSEENTSEIISSSFFAREIGRGLSFVEE